MKEDTINESTPGVIPWPAPINETGRIGIAGEFTELVSPHTEADPNALLLTFLTFSGNVLGRNFYVMAGADPHYGNLFTCLIGNTGHGRKGSAISTVEKFFGSRYSTDPTPKLGHVLKGISSGEAIVYEVHDDIWKTTLDKKSGKYERMLAEPNEPEKRLLIVLAEFQQCLANMRRPESILPSILRTAWDKGELSTPSKNSRATATGAHISVVAAMSREELLEQTSSADAENGTLNRFNFACTRRSKLLPQGGQFLKLCKSETWKNLQQRFNRNIEAFGEPIEMQRDIESEELWGLNEAPERGMYKQLNQPRLGLWGAVTARAPQIVLRLATITAAINGKRLIQQHHLDAAYEIWRYCDDSAKFIFGDRLDDPIAIDIMQALRNIAPSGLTRSQIYRIWKYHKNAEDINRSLVWLSHAGIARCDRIDTGGRPLETWFAT